MLVCLGLGRLEAGLMRHTLQPGDVTDFLDQASPSDVDRLARDGMPSAIESLHRRQLQRIEPSLEAVYEATTNGRPLPRADGVPMPRRHSIADSLQAGGAAV